MGQDMKEQKESEEQGGESLKDREPEKEKHGYDNSGFCVGSIADP